MSDSFDQTCQAVNDAIRAAPEPLRLVLDKAHDNCNDGRDITGFAVFCTALIAEMKPGRTRIYLENLRAVLLDNAHSWTDADEANEDSGVVGRAQVTCDEFSALKDGDIVSVWVSSRSGHQTEFHDWDENTPCLMRVLYRLDPECVVAVPFGRNGQWANTTVWADRTNIARVGYDDKGLIGRAEADMPRFRREFVEQVCRENERLLRTGNKELMCSLCVIGAGPEDFKGIVSSCPDDDIEGIVAALVDINELETEWRSEPYTGRTGR